MQARTTLSPGSFRRKMRESLSRNRPFRRSGINCENVISRGAECADSAKKRLNCGLVARPIAQHNVRGFVQMSQLSSSCICRINTGVIVVKWVVPVVQLCLGKV